MCTALTAQIPLSAGRRRVAPGSRAMNRTATPRSYFPPRGFSHVFGVGCRVRLALRPTIPAEARSTADGATHATRRRTNGDGIDCGAGFAGPLLVRPAFQARDKQGASDGLRHGTQEARPLEGSGGQGVASRPAASGRAREGRHGAPRRRRCSATRLTLRTALPRAEPGHFSARDTRRIASRVAVDRSGEGSARAANSTATNSGSPAPHKRPRPRSHLPRDRRVAVPDDGGAGRGDHHHQQGQSERRPKVAGSTDWSFDYVAWI
jgi:hypothetical protein